MKQRNVGACAKVHAKIVELSKIMPFSEMVKVLGIPRNTVQDYCKRQGIKVEVLVSHVKDFLPKIKQLASKGLTSTEISRQLGIGVRLVRYHANTKNIDVLNNAERLYTLETQEEVVKLYNKNFTYSEIAEVLGIPSKRVPVYLDKAGIVKRSNKETFDLRNNLKEAAFSDMEDEETVYWLGWIITDGCLSDNNSVSLSLKGEDVEIVQKFADYIKQGHVVKVKSYFHKQMQKNVESATFSVMNESIANNLRKQGVEPRKSCKERLPNFDYINSPLAPVFWRACIEGDGSVDKSLRSSGISLVGGEELLSGFVSFCEQVCLVKPGKTLRKRNYGNPDFRILSYSGEDARKIMRVLWSAGSIFLKRKKDIVESHLKHWDAK